MKEMKCKCGCGNTNKMILTIKRQLELAKYTRYTVSDSI